MSCGVKDVGKGQDIIREAVAQWHCDVRMCVCVCVCVYVCANVMMIQAFPIFSFSSVYLKSIKKRLRFS